MRKVVTCVYPFTIIKLLLFVCGKAFGWKAGIRDLDCSSRIDLDVPDADSYNGMAVPCDFLPDHFIDCEEPLDLKGNETALQELGYGCTKFGALKYQDVQRTNVQCRVLSCIECYGNRTFWRYNQPCIKYTGHYFLSTLLYSVLLGFIALDRFYLGHIGIAVGKLMTLGGFGVWWTVDIFLLVTGHLLPEDGSNWMPYY